MSQFFIYRQVSENLLADIVQRMFVKKESVAFIGSPYGGKRRVLKMLEDRLKQKQAHPVIHLPSPDLKQILTEDDFRNWLAQGFLGLSEEGQPDTTDPDEIFAPIDAYYARNKTPVMLLAPKVDNLPHWYARRFLEGVRVHVENGSLITALCGEDDFRGLIYGPNSQFNCARQYVLQGFAPDVYGPIAKEYMSILGLREHITHEIVQRFWELTGGQVFFLRILLLAVAERRARKGILPDKPLTADEIPDSIDLSLEPYFHAAHLASFAREILIQEPSEWKYLEEILQTGHVVLGPAIHAPTVLEIAGIATRNEQGELHFSSPLLGSYYQRYFTPRRMGDLYAGNSDWDNAFRWYGKKNSDHLSHPRPISIDDRTAVVAPVNAFCGALHMKASGTLSDLKDFFVKGCNRIMGVSDILFWSLKKIWASPYPRDIEGFADIENEIKQALESHQAREERFVQFPPHIASYLTAVEVDASPGTREFLVIGNYTDKHPMSLFRRKLLEEMIRHYGEAHSKTVEAVHNRERLETRNRHIHIINKIFDKILNNISNVKETLELTSRELQQLGYGKILFSLVDANGENLIGEVYKGGKNQEEVYSPRWPLLKESESLQKEVWKQKEYRIVENVREHELTRNDDFLNSLFASCALIPILDRNRKVIGTILVEKQDGTPPSQEEVMDLEIFTRQLAIAIIKNERIIFLQSMLDQTGDAVCIFDRNRRIRYINHAGAKLFNCRAGWVKNPELERFPGMKIGKIWPRVNSTFTSGLTTLEYLDGLGPEKNKTGKVWLDVITDWREQTIGAMLIIQDLTYLTKISEAFEIVASATDSESAMEGMLNAMKILGAEWGRLYMVDPNDPESMFSKYCYGFEDKTLENRFKKGELRLPRTIWESWISFDKKMPVVLSYLPDEDKEKQPWKTQSGLEVVNVKNPFSARFLKEVPGMFWFEFPLTINNQPYAKLSVACDEDMPPDHYELLKMLCQMCNKLLADVMEREKIQKEKEFLTFQVAEQATATAAHNIRTRLASLPGLLFLYEKEQDNRPKLIGLNKKFNTILNDVFASISRIKDRLVTTNPVFERLDIIDLLETLLKVDVGDGHWQLEVDSKPIYMTGDPGLMRNAISEIIHNAKSIHPAPDELMISVSIKLHLAKEELVLMIEDNGPGIPPHIKEKIFNAFFTHRTGQEPGVGLGLHYASRVIEAHLGTIAEDGEVGRGARFRIELPLHGSNKQ